MIEPRWALVATTAAIAGCGTASYLYAPEGATVMRGGAPAEIVRVPPEAPQGSVEIASRGITKVPTRNGTVRALDVRMIVDNEGDDQPWTVDTRDQIIEVGGAGQSRPMFARADVDSMPIVTVGRRQRRSIELFYPLPPNRQSVAQLPQFDLLWSVATPERTVAQRTHIRRIEVESPDYYADASSPYYAYGWGPYWWYDPFFPVYGPGFAYYGGFGPRFAGREGFHGGGFHGGGGFRGGGGGFHGGGGGHGGGGHR